MNIARCASRRTAWFLLALVVWVTWAMSVTAPPSMAQEKKAAPAAVPAAEGAKAAAPAAEEAKAAAGEEGKGAAPGGSGTEPPKQTKSALRWFLESSGPVGLFILVLSIYFVATIGRLFWELRITVAVPPEIVGRCQDLLGQRDFKGIFAVVKEDDSIFSRLLITGIGELPNGLAEARDVMERMGESVQVEMDKRISVLAVLGTLGPMIGLVGTLMGMIAAFQEIAMTDVAPQPTKIAGAISMALVITLEGVFLAVPAIWFFSLFRNRVMVITTNAGLEADQFLRHFAHTARGKVPAGAAGAAAATVTTATKVTPRAE